MKQIILDSLVRYKFWLALMPLVGALAGCTPGSSTETCGEINSAIDRNIMDIALSEIEGEASDKSAIQQNARLSQSNNRMSTISVNVLLLEQNKCQPRQKPIDASIYALQASRCYSAKLSQRIASYKSDEDKTAASAKVASACDFKAWNMQPSK